MWQVNLVAWACTAIGPLCTSVPTVPVIQAAYEREATAGSKLHDQGLKVLTSKCHDNSSDRFLCEVTFVSVNDPKERLYFDIVAVARADNGWQLTSGLCKR